MVGASGSGGIYTGVYEQTDGVAMVSPLSPGIANFFMEDFEKKALEQATRKPV